MNMPSVVLDVLMCECVLGSKMGCELVLYVIILNEFLLTAHLILLYEHPSTDAPKKASFDPRSEALLGAAARPGHFGHLAARGRRQFAC
jgi:hypothetical protein